MIFRTNIGKLIEINKHDYKNDLLYFKKIMEIKKTQSFAKLEKTFNNKNN